MSAKTYFSDKLNSLIFLEIKKEKIAQLFNMVVDENLYLPIKSTKIVDKIKSNNVDEFPVSFFIEGMFLVIGIDKEFRYNSYYVKVLNHIPDSLNFIKGRIAEHIKCQEIEEAYILLKGLVSIEENVENLEKLLFLAEQLRSKNKDFKEEELSIIEVAMKYEDFAQPYLYLSLLNKDSGQFEKAEFNLNTFLSKGGEETADIIEYKASLKQINKYERGKALIYEEPKEALRLLLSLTSELEENPSLYYYIAIAYRVLENYEKAIYYLNEVLVIDSDMVQAANELGINYASLGDYNTAIGYMRKAFEITKSIEICTNLVMCYINNGDIQQAKNHLEIAKKIDSNDQVVKELEQLIEKNYKGKKGDLQ